MLVVCNGAIKSGSTWLYNILTHLRPFSVPADEYLTMKNPRHPCIRPDRMREFLKRQDPASRDYLSKNHIDDPELRDFLVGEPEVFVFDIERDPKDVTVSHYYHECFRNAYTGSFEEFYWSVGRKVAASLSAYHDLWRDQGPRVYISSYERLHREFEEEVKRIAAVLGESINSSQARALHEKTSLATLRKDYEKEPRFEGQKFFRKGSIGDWQNHFDARMLEDIERVTNDGIGKLDFSGLRWRLSSALRR